MSRPGLYEQIDTCVLWDIEDCQIPNGLDPYKIQQNIKSALANNGYHGNVTIKAYSEKHQIAEEFESAGIGLVPDGDKYDRIRSMKQEIFCFAYDPIGKPSNLMVISRDKNEFVKSLNSYKKRGFNILLASTQNIERQCCNCAMPPMKKLIDPSTEWLWRSLAFGGDPIAEDKDEEGKMVKPGYEAANTCVLWDIEECQIPNGLDPCKIQHNIKSALANVGYHGNVTIKAYSEKHQIAEEFESAGISLVPRGDKHDRYIAMMLDIFGFVRNNLSKPSNLMVISREKHEFADCLNPYKDKGLNILLAWTRNPNRQCCNCPTHSEKLINPSSEWLWTSLSLGGDPIAHNKDNEDMSSVHNH